MTTLQELIQNAENSKLPEPIKAEVINLIKMSFQAGKDTAVEYIEKNAEEAVKGLFYVTKDNLQAARTTH